MKKGERGWTKQEDEKDNPILLRVRREPKESRIEDRRVAGALPFLGSRVVSLIRYFIGHNPPFTERPFVLVNESGVCGIDGYISSLSDSCMPRTWMKITKVSRYDITRGYEPQKFLKVFTFLDF